MFTMLWRRLDGPTAIQPEPKASAYLLMEATRSSWFIR